MSAKVLLQEVIRIFRSQTRLWYVFLCRGFVTFYRVVRARILPDLGLVFFQPPMLVLDIQPGLCSFQRVFVFHFFFKLFNDVLV